MYPAGCLDIFRFPQIPIIGESHEIQLLISENPLTCDCRDYDIIAELQRFNRSDWVDGVKCKLPSQRYGDKVSFIVCHLQGLIQYWDVEEKERRGRADDFQKSESRHLSISCIHAWILGILTTVSYVRRTHSVFGTIFNILSVRVRTYHAIVFENIKLSKTS